MYSNVCVIWDIIFAEKRTEYLFLNILKSFLAIRKQWVTRKTL